MNRVFITSGRSFDAFDHETILEAASRQGLSLPHSCLTGRCNTCKSRIHSGVTSPLHPETGLSELEIADGWILNCVRTVKSDIILDVDELVGISLPSVKTLPCRISCLEYISSDIVLVKLRLPHTSDFNFIPGQYIDVIGPNGLRRSYSLANSCLNPKLLELHIRFVKNGAMSEYWFKQARVNDLLRIKGPQGTFFLRNIANKDLVFLATGTGLAPVKSILDSLSFISDYPGPRSITVFWGGRTSADFYFDVPSISGGFKFVPVISGSDTNWKGARGYVQNQLLVMSADLTQSVVYACGSENMIRSAKELLIQSGLPAGQFYSDAFVCSSSK